MSKFTILEHKNGTFTVANSNKTKHWENTRTSDRMQIESKIRIFTIRHEMAKVQKLFDEMNEFGLDEIDNLREVGHWANDLVNMVTDTNGDEHDPKGWTC